MITVSLSAVRLFRECEEAYYRRHVLGLSLDRKDYAMSLGNILHTYLSIYYLGIKEHILPGEAHLKAVISITIEYEAEIISEANRLWEKGDEADSIKIRGMVDHAKRIANRYFETRGRRDAEEHEILYIEQVLDTVIVDGQAKNRSVLDLVTRHLSTGHICLWEHKTVGTIPDDIIRLQDLQTVLYKVIAEHELDLVFDRVVWNYLRTKEPTVPEQLKNGQLSQRKDLDSTWETYKNMLDILSIDETPYSEVKERLEGREITAFFPRFELPYLANAALLLRDYATSVGVILERREQWKKGEVAPVRSFSFRCNRCEFSLLCKTALLGGDVEDAVRLKFKNRYRQQQGSEGDVQTITSDDIDTSGWDDILEDL